MKRERGEKEGGTEREREGRLMEGRREEEGEGEKEGGTERKREGEGRMREGQRGRGKGGKKKGGRRGRGKPNRWQHSILEKPSRCCLI